MSDKTADSYQVSPQQEQLWLAAPDGPSARTQVLLALVGPLDTGALEAALRRAAGRHESLRTTFVRQPGFRVPLQVVNDRLDPAFDVLDLGELDPAAQATRLEAVLRQELEQPLDFTNGPLARALLLSYGADRHELVLTLSALCADPSSVPVLLAELVAHYADTGGLIDDPLQYADFSAWQRELAESEEPEAVAAAEFWSALAEAAPASPPFARSGSGTFLPDHVALDLDDELAASVAAQAERYGADASVFLQAAWHAALGRFSGEDHLSVAYLSSERRHPDLDGAVGAFGRPVPIRTRASAEVTFAELLRAVAQARDDTLAWQDYAPADGAARFPVGFIGSGRSSGRAGELLVTLERVISTGPQFRIWLTCIAGERELDVRISFDPGSHRRDHVQRLARGLECLLRGVAADPGQAIGELQLLDEQERRHVLEDFNDTAAPVPEAGIHELIAAHAATAPERDAVLDEHGAIAYGALDARANQLANRLRRSGVGPDVAVGLCTDRSIEMVVGLLGILKAGGAYVPLHYEHPAARLHHQLETAGARAIVTQAGLLDRLPEFDGELVCLDRDRPELDAEPAIAPDVSVSSKNLAYIVYTSGSTGAPKGVAVTHGNLANYSTDIARRLGADAEPQAFGVVTSISTDLGNTSMFGALCSGGSVVLVSPVAAADGGALARQLETTPIDVLKITPSHLGALLAGGDRRVLPRRSLVIGGERAPWDLVGRVQALSDCAVLNHYGPTETTVGCCTYPVLDGPGEYEPASVPIGRPIANTSCYVLDQNRQPLPIGVAGRLFVAGAGVARGYVGEPELTAERFSPDPFAPGAGARMYDTGDLARWLPDGTLEFRGRADEQIKIRGYRVEPAELEAALRSHPRVHEAVAVTHESAAGDLRLVAYCVVDGAVGADELRAHISGWLPEFMMPAAILILDSLPRTPSGKLDRRSLPDPDTFAHDVSEYVAPQTPLEQAVAEIWSRVLGVDRVGAQDDFFSLGGHSLLATQVVAQVRSDFAVELPLHSLFTYPTIASLTSEIVRMMGDGEDETAKLMAELEGMSDEEAERLLADGRPGAGAGSQ